MRFKVSKIEVVVYTSWPLLVETYSNYNDKRYIHMVYELRSKLSL